MKSFSHFYTPKTTVQYGESRLVFMSAEQPAVDSENNDDLGALAQRLELLQGKVDTQVLVSQVAKATDHFWQKTNADQVINDYCTNPDSAKVQPLLDASRMTNNQSLADQLFWRKGGAATLGESLKIFRMQFVGKIEGKIAEQVQNAGENEKDAVRQNGSKLLEQLLAQESSANETVADSLYKSMRAVSALDYLQKSRVAEIFNHKYKRADFAKKMENEGTEMKVDNLGFVHEGDTWKWQQVHVLTGAGMMDINTDLLNAFQLKDMIVVDKDEDTKVVIARMQNGCQGNLFTAEIKKIQTPVVGEPVRRPNADNIPTDEPEVTPTDTEPPSNPYEFAPPPPRPIDSGEPTPEVVGHSAEEEAPRTTEASGGAEITLNVPPGHSGSLEVEFNNNDSGNKNSPADNGVSEEPTPEADGRGTKPDTTVQAPPPSPVSDNLPPQPAATTGEDGSTEKPLGTADTQNGKAEAYQAAIDEYFDRWEEQLEVYDDLKAKANALPDSSNKQDILDDITAFGVLIFGQKKSIERAKEQEYTAENEDTFLTLEDAANQIDTAINEISETIKAEEEKPPAVATAEKQELYAEQLAPFIQTTEARIQELENIGTKLETIPASQIKTVYETELQNAKTTLGEFLKLVKEKQGSGAAFDEADFFDALAMPFGTHENVLNDLQKKYEYLVQLNDLDQRHIELTALVNGSDFYSENARLTQDEKNRMTRILTKLNVAFTACNAMKEANDYDFAAIEDLSEAIEELDGLVAQLSPNPIVATTGETSTVNPKAASSATLTLTTEGKNTSANPGNETASETGDQIENIKDAEYYSKKLDDIFANRPDGISLPYTKEQPLEFLNMQYYGEFTIFPLKKDGEYVFAKNDPTQVLVIVTPVENSNTDYNFPDGVNEMTGPISIDDLEAKFYQQLSGFNFESDILAA